MHIVNERGDVLGESPSWLPAKKRLYWVDIKSKRYHYLDQNWEIYSFNTPDIITSLYPDSEGILMGTLRDTFITVNPDDHKLTRLASVGLPERIRFNDGKPDRQGNYWAGTMDAEEKEPLGKLYVYVRRSGEVKELLSGLIVSNGLCWDYETKTFYHIDSPRRRIMAYDFSDSEPAIWNPRVAVDFSSQPGVPDGMTIDEEGNLWVAHWGGSHISMWNPKNGSIIRTIRLPAQRITSCVFGGDDYSLLFVTSARLDGAPKEDLGGSLFILDEKDLASQA